METLKSDLIKRVKMLEFALRQERFVVWIKEDASDCQITHCLLYCTLIHII